MSEACKILNLLPRARFLRLLNLGLPASVRQGSGGGVLRGPSKHTGAEWLGEWLSVHVCDPFARRFPDSCGFDGGGGGGGVNLHDAAPGSAKDVGGSVSGCVWWLATAEMSALILRALHVVASSWSASSGRPVGGDGGVGGEGGAENEKGEEGGVGDEKGEDGGVGKGLIAQCSFARDCLLLHQHLCAMDPQLQVECVLL